MVDRLASRWSDNRPDLLRSLSAHARFSQEARKLTLSCTKLSCCRFRQSVAEAAETEDEENEEEMKTEVPSVRRQRHLSLNVSSRHERKRPKVLKMQKNTHRDQETDDRFMREALCEAQKAAAIGEVPVGAVLVSQGRVVARAHNRVERENDPTAHAEMICIRNTARHLGGWRLLQSTMYVTLEPCPMCAGALLQARVGAVVWGTRNPLLGADGSWVSLFPKQLSAVNSEEQMLDSQSNGAAQDRYLIHPFNPDINVRGGILASECSQIMKDFFRQRRKESKKLSTTSCSLLSRLIFAMKRALQVLVSFIKYSGLDRMFYQRV